MGIYSDYVVDNCILQENVNKDTNEFLSFAKIFIMHLLKYAYQPQRQTRSWLNSIATSYENIISEKRKSVWNAINNTSFEDILQKSLKDAINETKLSELAFNIQEFKSYYNSFASLTDKSLLIKYLMHFNANSELTDYIANI